MKTFLIVLSAYYCMIGIDNVTGQGAVQPPINQNIPVNPPIGIDVPQQPIPVSPPIWHLPQTNGHPTVEILININGIPTPYNQQNLISITINDPNHPDYIPIVPHDETEPIVGGVDFLPDHHQPIVGGIDFIDTIQPIHGGLGFIPNDDLLRFEEDDENNKNNEPKFTPY